MADTNYPSANNPQTNRPANNTTKNVLIGILAAGLLGTWGYFLYDKNQSTEKIQLTQTQATTAMSSRDSVQTLYNDALTRLDSITGSNNNLQGKLSENNSQITKLKNEINRILRDKNASAADLRRAKGLIAELNDKIVNLEQEVARLTGENQQLASSNTQLTQEREVLQTNLQTTTAEKDELARTVDVASTFTASNIQITPIKVKHNGKEKVTDKAKRVDKLVVSFDVENRVARSGPADMYVIVTAPDGTVISDPNLGSSTLTTRQDGDKPFTTKTTVNYVQGERANVQLPISQSNFQTGNYKIEIYQNGFKIAEGVRSLRKGGLFG
jgi:peptidoglycan hydrolase CwlO-like protein